MTFFGITSAVCATPADLTTYVPPSSPIEIPVGYTKDFYVSPQGSDAKDVLSREKSGASGFLATIVRAWDDAHGLMTGRAELWPYGS